MNCLAIPGSEGKLALTEQKLSTLKAIGNLSKNTVSGVGTQQNLSTTVAELFIPVLSSEGRHQSEKKCSNKYFNRRKTLISPII